MVKSVQSVQGGGIWYIVDIVRLHLLCVYCEITSIVCLLWILERYLSITVEDCIQFICRAKPYKYPL